ncbi:type II secretion system protein [bacterium]|nr:type II secretion system protein [bacterium]
MGSTLLEVMVMSVIVLILATSLIGLLINSLKLINRNRARAFALEKCNQMIEEITAYSLAGEDIIEIDRFKDIVPLPILSADTTISDPSNTLSGNVYNNFGNWKFLRVIDILPIKQEPRARIVSAKVYYSDEDDPSKEGLLLSQLTKLLKTAGDIFPPSQVYDIYAIAIENTPGWWVDMSVMKPMMHEAINQVQARNPGLEYRVHWITRNGFGRDRLYSPYFNLSSDAIDNNALPYTYIYPSAIVGEDGFFTIPLEMLEATRLLTGSKWIMEFIHILQ